VNLLRLTEREVAGVYAAMLLLSPDIERKLRAKLRPAIWRRVESLAWEARRTLSCRDGSL